MQHRRVLGVSVLLVALAGAAAAQEAAPAAGATSAAAPRDFSSAAQARQYLSQNPEGARAEAAFRTTVIADLLARYPGFDPAQVAAGSALTIAPGATETPEQIDAILTGTTPGIGAVRRSGFW
ncbi:MAG: hypothetical protein U1E34_11250 [Amaricoccus sp.]